MEQPQPQPQQGRTGPRTWVVVALTLGAVLVVGLVFVGGVVTGIAIGGTSGGGTSAGGNTPEGSAGSGDGGSGELDPCLVGTWRTVEHSESADTDQGTVTISGVQRTLQITADGTETVTYDRAPARVTTDRGEGEAVYDGTVVYRVGTSGRTMSFELKSADGTLEVSAPGSESRTQELSPGAGDVTYTCEGDRFTQEAPGFRAILERAP